MTNFKDGIIRDGSSIGAGKALGNIKDGIISNGEKWDRFIFNLKSSTAEFYP